MKTKPASLYKRITILLLLFLLVAVLTVLLYFRHYSHRFDGDFNRFSTEEYDSAFLSMYPIDNYDEADFNYWHAKQCIFTENEIQNAVVLEKYLDKISLTGSRVDTIYLGVRPDKISGEDLAEILSAYPQYHFYLLLAHPSMEYWTALSEEDCRQALADYQSCITWLFEQPNASLYSWGDAEWLICNPANYEDTFLTNAAISKHLMHFEEFPEHWINATGPEAAMDKLTDIVTQYRSTPSVSNELAEETIVFFGDSVIGNYTLSNSIPNVAGALTGATAYNLGLGGTPAARPDSGATCLVSIVDAFLAADPSLLPADSQARLGLEEYLDAAPAQSDSAASDTPYCFIINYGLNDYFMGLPISSEDPYDVSTFTGAFRTVIRNLRTAYPEARILVNTPNFTSYFNNGTDAMSDHGHQHVDYVEALIALASEADVELVDVYHELDINADNHPAYLLDGCHPNEKGRFLIGQMIAEQLLSGTH